MSQADRAQVLPPSAPRPRASVQAFRPDIQALRAIAVVAVLLYHLWPERVPGGFIGVDVFFVISGFLITQHLLQEVQRTGRVALGAFWARRIRRLLPAAFVVIAASLLLLVLVMPPVTWERNLEQLRASALYVVNWLLGFQAVDYLASEANATMALHYWSLAVEEQFYLVWPLLIVFGVWWARRQDARVRLRRIVIVLVAVTVTSLALSIVLTPRVPEIAFFATPLRAWQFGAGALVAIFSAQLTLRIPVGVRTMLSWTGWATIALACVFVDGTRVQFPGWIALIPVLAAVVCLGAGGEPSRWSADRLARAQPVQWLGDNSYAIYLWHWPLIIAAPWLLGQPLKWPAKLVIVVLTFALAWATKRWVEDPVRTGAWWRANLRRAYGFAVIGAVLVTAVTSIWLVTLSQTWERMEAESIDAIRASEPCFAVSGLLDDCSDAFERPSDMEIAFAASNIDKELNRCQQPTAGDEPVLCTYGDESDPVRTIAVIGNSHALRLIPALDLYGDEHGWRVILAAKTNCLGPIVDIGDPALADCQSWSRNVRDVLVARGDVDAVMFASHVGAKYYLGGEDPSASDMVAVEQGVLDTYADYEENGMKVMVLGDVPGTRPLDAPTCVQRSSESVDPCAADRASVDIPNTMDDISEAHPEAADYVSMADFVCGTYVCHAVIGGVVVYSDSHHLTTSFSQSLSDELGMRVQALLGDG